MVRIRRAGVIAAVAALSVCAPARASVVTVPANKQFVWVQYDASPGEANRVSVVVGTDPTGSSQVTITDPGAAVIQTPPSDDPTVRGCVPAGLHRVSCRADRLDYLQVSLGDGNDTFAISGLPVWTNLSGGDGDDRLAGGAGGANFTPGLGADTIIGASDFDQVTYLDHPAGVRVSLDGVANDGMPGEGDNVIGVYTVVGSAHEDVLTGSDGPDQLVGNPGRDIIAGRGGDDVLYADGGDQVAGGSGRDTIVASNGGNTIYAIDGEQDRVTCGPPSDNVLHVDAIDVVTNC